MKDVVFQSSNNFGERDANTAWNNAITFQEDAAYAHYHKYFGDIREYYNDKTGDDNYYWVGDSANQYKTHFFPRHESSGASLDEASADTIISISTP